MKTNFSKCTQFSLIKLNVFRLTWRREDNQPIEHGNWQQNKNQGIDYGIKLRFS
jgi:hypothetical protein